MGVAPSSINNTPNKDTKSKVSEDEGIHFYRLVNPSKTPRSAGSENEKAEARNGIDYRARVLKRISFYDLWIQFLSGTAQSFALTPAELHALLLETIEITQANESNSLALLNMDSDAAKPKGKNEKSAIEAEIKDYIDLVLELSEKFTSKTIDFMAVCSSSLLLSKTPLEMKVDQLYNWIKLSPERNSFNYEDFLVALSSFESGLSYAMKKPACSEAYVKEIAKSWLALADPTNSKGYNSDAPKCNINDKQFFEFCTNRQHVVRRLLEALASLEVIEDKNLDLQEVDNDAIDLLKKPHGGDEWMANPAWKKTAERMIPPHVKQTYKNMKPTSNLTLEWVHGYRGFDCRNNARSIQDGQIVFTAAALCVVQDSIQQKQYYFSEHNDDILCMTTSPQSNGSTLIASGEIGKTPAIYLYAWTPKPGGGGGFQSFGCFKGFHTKGITQLAFSEDGKFLFTVGVEYTVAIYATDTSQMSTFGKMIASSQGPKDKIMHASRYGVNSSSEYKFSTCGEKHAIFWKFDANRKILTQETAKLGEHKNKMLLCASYITQSDLVLFSTSEGDVLYGKEGTNVSKVMTEESDRPIITKSAINAIWTHGGGADTGLVLTGDKDGHVICWRISLISGDNSSGSAKKGGGGSLSVVKLTSQWHFTIYGYNKSVKLDGILGEPVEAAPKPPAIRAISLIPSISSGATKMLVGTQNCELIQYSVDLNSKVVEQTEDSSQIMVSGHFLDEIWGLAVRPITEQNVDEGVHYATVGDDGYLRIWRLDTHSLILCLNLKAVARCCSYSPDGNYIAIGFGPGKGGAGGKNKKAGTKAKEDGAVKVIRIDPTKAGKDVYTYALTQVAEIKEAKQWISVVKFSPDGSTLAVGSRDNSMYLFSVPNQFKRKVKFSKHNAGINQLDFSADGKYIQSCCRYS